MSTPPFKSTSKKQKSAVCFSRQLVSVQSVFFLTASVNLRLQMSFVTQSYPPRVCSGQKKQKTTAESRSLSICQLPSTSLCESAWPDNPKRIQRISNMHQQWVVVQPPHELQAQLWQRKVFASTCRRSIQSSPHWQ